MDQDFTQGQGEAMQALLNALGTAEHNGQKPTPEMVQQMAERLNALLDDGKELNDASVNQTGEVLNEDGEPVIEITEPYSQSGSGPAPDGDTADEDPFIPISDLDPERRARRKAETARILDMLEAEEDGANEKERRKSLEALERRKREAEKKKAPSKKLDEKKMGKALLKGLSEEPASAPRRKSDSGPEKKKVTFSDDVPPSPPPKTKMEWGDVVAALPSSSTRRMLQSSKHPMRSNVVERFPSATTAAAGDSDDEDGDDDDVKQHREEVMNEYNARRKDIVDALPDALKGMSISREGTTHDQSWDQEDVPLDASLSSKPSKPKGASRFKASILPESSSSALRASIKRGKLEDGKLVGPAEDSDTEDIVHARNALLKAEVDSGASTPVSSERRSSPKLPDVYTTPTGSALRESKGPPPRAQKGAATKKPTASNPMSMIVESPSFAPPPKQDSNIIRDPPILAETVSESTTRKPYDQDKEDRPRRVSRFKAERAA